MTAAFIDSTGGDGWAYLTAEHSTDRLIRLAMAEKADEMLERRHQNAVAKAHGAK